jgi:hypothetical protein
METLTDMVGDKDKTFGVFAKNIMSQMYCALPAIVDSVDFTNQTITAKPVTIMKYTNDSGVVSDFQLPILQDVPFQCYKGGGYSITVPVKEGDECLIIFTDVDFSAWFQNGGFQYAEHSFIHSYTNAMAIIGFSSEVNAIPDYNPNAVEIRNTDASEKISLSEGNITLKSDTITLDGNVTTTGTSDLQGTTTIEQKAFLSHVHSNGNEGANTGGVQ